MRRLLFTGVSGMLGQALWDCFYGDPDYFICGIFNHHPIGSESTLRAFDLKNSSYTDLMQWADPDIIVHCAALTDVDYCEDYPDEAYDVNAYVVARLLEAKPTVKIIYISTDAVYGERKLPAKNTDPIAPLSVYGKSKAMGESYLKYPRSPHLIVRTTIVGLQAANRKNRSYVNFVIDASCRGQSINLFIDNIFTPITVWNLAREIKWACANDLQGVFNISGSEAISKYDFGMSLLRNLNFLTDHILPISMSTVQFKAPRSFNQSLDSASYTEISGRILPSVSDTIAMITKMYQEKKNET